MTLAVGLLVLVLLQQFVLFMGEDSLFDKIWSIYTLLSRNPDLHKYHEQRSEQYSLYKQQQLVSAQDEYAKWTKINRKLDSLKKDIEQTSQKIAVHRSTLQSLFKTFLYLTLRLPIWFCSFWWRKSLVFYLPPGCLPSYVMWFLRFPNAPPNAVGITVWCFAINTICKTVVALFRDFTLVSTPLAAKLD